MAKGDPCIGFSPDTFDKYVLGLLDGREREQVDRQIELRCPTCLSGVQRSMNLWLVFANSMEQTEPAADFRGRLVRIAELSNRVLTVPKRHMRMREPALVISSLLMISLIFVTLLILTWIAGRQSARMDAERGTAELQRLTRELIDKQTTVQQQSEQIRALDSRHAPPTASLVTQQKKLEDALSKAQAAVEQYKLILAREGKAEGDNYALINALGAPGTKLLNFKGAEGVTATAYGLVSEGTRVVVVANNLPPLDEKGQYQLWIVRKEEPHYVSAGLFTVVQNQPSVVSYREEKEAITNMAGLLITEEPQSGSAEPKGARVLETQGAAAVAATVASAPE